jgi:outer membrane protein OmpA-like peptidoglycan-associated protein
VTRRILRGDLQNAREYQQNFGERMPETLPGSTAIGVSAAVLNDLKTKGEASFTYQQGGLMGALGGLLNGIGAMTDGMGGNAKDKEEMAKSKAEMEKLSKVNCQLKRVGNKDAAFPVLLNNEPVELPAVRATCTTDDDTKADFYFLDDPDNPLSLAWKVGDTDRLQVVNIRYAPADKNEGNGSAEAQQMEEKLAKKENVKVYGIYFDFASAKIRPQSKPTLDEIAGVMKAHADWVLRVEGHTDNVGGDAFNQRLSEQRAAAVKKTLVDDYHIPDSNLTTAGYGAARPADTNETMEGRARNRRVELARQ